MTLSTTSNHPGMADLLERPFMETMWRRRTHRVSSGIGEVAAGSMTYKSSDKPQPLDELEEAVLIAATGCTGLTMPDRPFQDPATGTAVMAKPNLTMDGRTAGSPDNAQGTYFFLINDSGTYFLRKLPSLEVGDPFAPDILVERARQAKVKILDKRLEVPGNRRNFPAYLDSNRLLSNLPGTTVLFPVVDLSHQYINGLMYLLTQPDGARPMIVDDHNFYLPAGVLRWVRGGFLNRKIPVPLGVIGSLRTQIEADLLLQTLFLTADAMGLGAYIHGSISPPVIMGDPKFRPQYGRMLGFDHVIPRWRFLDTVRWNVLLPSHADIRAHPVALRHDGEYLIKAMCPPNYATMDEAVDTVIAEKFGPDGVYRDNSVFDRIYNDGYGQRYLNEARQYSSDVIECVKDVCNYIYDTHRRFPAHCDAIHVPGVWLQVHHVEIPYYERFFRNGLTDVHRQHGALWHGSRSMG
jgi:hypothetical protein